MAEKLEKCDGGGFIDVLAEDADEGLGAFDFNLGPVQPGRELGEMGGGYGNWWCCGACGCGMR